MTVKELIEALQKEDQLSKVEIYVEDIDEAFASISVDGSNASFGIVYLNV
jgi:hypothetical protein